VTTSRPKTWGSEYFDDLQRLMQQRDEARGLLEAAYAKCDRAEKMLRTAAAKADEWRECAEGLARLLRQRIDHDDDVFLDWEADQLAVFDRLKKEGK
jgi:hypothetical protein